MLFFIHCIDKPDHTHVRKATREAHLAYLDEFKDSFFAVGPTLSEDGETMTGSVILMDFSDRKACISFTENDPYNKAELFENVVVHRWKKVLPKD
jgi:uncharacterized protein